MPPRHFSEGYEEMYDWMLGSVRSCPALQHELTISAFWTHVGPAFEPGKSTLFVGRATNGWGDQRDKDSPWFTRHQGIEVSKVREYVEDVEHHVGELDWLIDEACLARSFWKVVRGVLDDRPDWIRQVAWTELYKLGLAKQEKDGVYNPSDQILDAQWFGCSELLRMEIDELEPGYTVFLTGQDWLAEFYEVNWFDETKPVVSGYLKRGRYAIAAPHPEAWWRSGNTIEKLIDLIRNEY